MSQYDLLGLMATHKQLKSEGVVVPATFTEFVAGVKPINSNTDGTLHARR